MAGDVYGSFEFAQKGFTRGSDVGKGQLGLPHLDPPLFLELKLIKIHTHTGVDSSRLKAEAVPEVVRGYKTQERMERGIAIWTGSASASGSIVLTYGAAFQEAPTVLVTCAQNDVNIQVGTNTPTATQVTILWKNDTAATHTSVAITYCIIGR